MNKFFTLIGTLSILASATSADMLICKNPEHHIVQDSAQKSTYKNCKRNGMTWWFKDDGNIKSKVNFTNGQENGLYTSYHTNGQVKILVNYVDGQKDGVQKIFYDNGQLGSQVTYHMGRREGIMTDWDVDGYKSAEVFYKNNYKVGLKKYFDHKGNVTRTETFKMDRNPVMQRLLKDKHDEVMVDLAKYGLVPADTPKEQRFK